MFDFKEILAKENKLCLKVKRKIYVPENCLNIPFPPSLKKWFDPPL